MLTEKEIEYIKSNPEDVVLKINNLLKKHPNVEDWLWDEVECLVQNPDSMHIIDFLNDYKESSLDYLGEVVLSEEREV